ncbi:MAG: Zn-dependent exopeptidase M28 [Chloroflexi bacterium]|nr:MAG: Zn-dependent exopeptidase M28 [Chloroflexota bacterium]MBL1197160.1 Zn-dependent exopeptidase M28 [Chloroflexota bacterium]NOH14455.1 M28 family peptidase [Chloroflexota bacterium]
MISTAQNHFKAILEHGPRPIGSQANQDVADYISGVFQDKGLSVEEQPYDCTAWAHNSTTMEQDGERLEASANPFSLPCDVTTSIIPAGSIAELEAVSASGKILLLYGDLTRVPLSCKSWFLKDERSEEIIKLIESQQAAAILAPQTDTHYYNQFTEDWELDVASATIPTDVALRLLNLPEKPVSLKIEAERLPATARNIVARTSNTSGKRLVICAHFDTKINTPGATDNGGGIAALLSLAETLPHDLPFGLEFVAFNGEEYLPIGDDEYIRRSEDYFNDIFTCINIDGAGAALGSNNITAIAASDEMEASIRAVAAQFPGVVWTEPWPESNHSTFSFRGIPAIPISATGTRGLAHSVDDTFEQVSSAKLDEVVSLVTELMNDFAKIT